VALLKQFASAIALGFVAVTPALAAGPALPPAPMDESAVPPLPDYLFASQLTFPDIPEVTGSLHQSPSPSPFADDFNAVATPRPAWSSPLFWRGFYAGGQFGYSSASGDFSDSTQAPIAYGLRELTLESEFAPSNWPVLGTDNHSAAGFGGFVGYNVTYLQAVFGVEANYDQASLSLTAPNSPISRLTPADSGGNTYLVNITGSGTVNNLDFGTLRAKGGWAFGNFLPYAFVGAAIGRADVHISETTSGQQNPPSSGACDPSPLPPTKPCIAFSFPGSAGKDGEWLYGGTVGAGLDVALTRNVFVRGEYEYVYFEPVDGVHIAVNTVRVGAGVKF
jgi:outer membrane immunogenic protein